MVVHYLRVHFCGGLVFKRAGFHDCGDGRALESGADERRCGAVTLSRSRKVAAGAGNALELLRVFTVSTNLVREFARGDSLVSTENTWRLGRYCAGCNRASFCFSVSVSVVSLAQAARGEARYRGSVDSGNALDRSVLDDRAKLYGGGVSLQLDGSGCSYRHGWFVARCFCPRLNPTSVDTD